jgi:hypothetical protein
MSLLGGRLTPQRGEARLPAVLLPVASIGVPPAHVLKLTCRTGSPDGVKRGSGD